MIRYDERLAHFGIKLLDDRTVEKTARAGTVEQRNFVERLCKHFIRHPDPMVVPIYEFEAIDRIDDDKRWGLFPYRYTMKRLGMISKDEKDIVWLSSLGLNGSRCNSEEMKTLNRASKRYPAMLSFVKKVQGMRRYRDFHDGNVLIDEEENYRLIDIEGFVYTPFDRPENNWITKL